MPLTPNTRAVLTHLPPRSVDAPDDPRAMAASAPPVPVRGPHNDRENVPGVQRGVARARVFSLFRLSVAPASKSSQRPSASAPRCFVLPSALAPHDALSMAGPPNGVPPHPHCAGWTGQGGETRVRCGFFFRVPCSCVALPPRPRGAPPYLAFFPPSCTPWLPFMKYFGRCSRQCGVVLGGCLVPPPPTPPRRLWLDWVPVS